MDSLRVKVIIETVVDPNQEIDCLWDDLRVLALKGNVPHDF